MPLLLMYTLLTQPEMAGGSHPSRYICTTGRMCTSVMAEMAATGNCYNYVALFIHAGSDDEEPQPQQVKSKKDESTVMDKLTDLVEKQMDENKMKKAFQALRQQEEEYKEAERLLAKKLAAVKVNKDDVSLVAQEMEISMQQTDRKLRESDGDVVKCLHNLVAA
ncbi:hypothetical protein PsorP6_012167 [Peronosclerospora sorghi]|uniref:Uncharacterized protein n=1 Tax=Peronosclerospora sorghi TaxID=230839 RepID=A0ACC0WKS0_9STRA|nr:hypothetical protein PsorP6_012167 [Peronosclerospora sorghi]